jgi:predicted Zn-dependent protease
MKRWAILASIVVFGIGVLVLSEKRKAGVEVGPRSILNFIADTGRELAHVPAAVTPLSDQEEIRIGDELASQYGSRMSLPGENADAISRWEAYVQKVGLRVAGRAQRPLPYRFHYLPNKDFVNAFALPGGHVFIGAGLIRFMNTEDELANVLGHEVEHIDRRHCAERVQLEMRVRKLPLGELVALPIELFEAGYSKAQELEADRRGTALAVWAGYSPLGAIRMFETFAKLERDYSSPAKTPGQELSQVAQQSLAGYFRSHPPAQERIDQIRGMITDNHWENLTSERPLEVADAFRPQRAKPNAEFPEYRRHREKLHLFLIPFPT